jgi:uncharacterized tellurite resistance protein B-like protein
MVCLVPIFQQFLARDTARDGIARRTLISLTGSDKLVLKRSGPGFLAAGCIVLLLGAFAGAWMLVLGATLVIVGLIQLFTTKPEPAFASLDFNVIRALASDASPAPDAHAAISAQDDVSEVHQIRGLQALNALIATTSNRNAGPMWIPFETPYRFGSLTLPRGGFYVGRPGSPPHDVDCAIDPKLDFTLAKPDWLGRGLNYWPRYAKLTPEERGTFLAFLHSPRRAGGVAVGYVFIFIYNLEHRLVRDAAAGLVSSEEGRTIIDELVGVIQAYGPKSASIGKYVGELLGVAYARFPEHVPATPIAGAGWSTAQRIAFAAAAGRGPLSADWAFAWASSHMPAINSATWSAMLPVVRDLFEQRYTVSPLATRELKKPRTKLRINYRWAAFTGARVEAITCDVADYAAAESLAIPYQALLQAVCEDLESMRRLQRAEVPAGAALAAAPVEIARKAVTPKLAIWASSELAAIRAKGTLGRRAQDVASALGWIGTAKFGKREATQIAQALQAMGIGVEPDPRFGGATPKPDTELVLFELPVSAARAPSPAYAAAHLMVTAAASLGGIDGHAGGELDSALTGIAKHFQLSEAERARLSAVVAGSVSKPVRPTAVANKVKTLPETQRHALAAVLVDIALADGHVSPAEIRLLERFYGALSLDPATLHADLHHGSLGAKKTAARPAAAPGAAPSAPAALDTDAIAKKLEETARVQSMLAEIFVDDTPAPASAVPERPAASDDAVHTDALHLVAGQDALERADWDAFCESRDLMPDAALEALNEWSLERTGEVLLDGDDPLEVNTYARDQLAPPANDSTPA